VTGRTTWGTYQRPAEREFIESTKGIEPEESDRVEVEDIGQAMGWRDPSDTTVPEEPKTKAAEDSEPPSEQDLEMGPSDYIPGRVFAHQDNKEKRIWCDFMEIFLEEKKLKARGDVQFEAENLEDEDRPPRGKVGKAIASEYTWVDADYMNYFWDDELVDTWGGAHAWQDEKDLVARNITYSDTLGLLLAHGDVVSKQLSGRWLKEHEILEDIKDEEAREDAQKPTTVFSNSSLSYTESDWSFGWGDVLFEQKEQRIRGQRVEYDDSSEIMVMYDEVQFKNEDEEWMLADKLIMDFYLENYFVEGSQSRARVLVPEEYRDDLEEWEKEREGIEEEEEPEEGEIKEEGLEEEPEGGEEDQEQPPEEEQPKGSTGLEVKSGE
jgi:hypothetical protein